MVRFFVRVRVIRNQAEGIQVGGDSFQHTDLPRSVESNKLRLDIFIGPKIHNHVFATLQPISAAAQHFNFGRVEKLVDSTRTQSGRVSDFANR